MTRIKDETLMAAKLALNMRAERCRIEANNCNAERSKTGHIHAEYWEEQYLKACNALTNLIEFENTNAQHIERTEVDQ